MPEGVANSARTSADLPALSIARIHLPAPCSPANLTLRQFVILLIDRAVSPRLRSVFDWTERGSV